jgi:RNA polymerase sigma-70 factor (ECF subfamily)
MQHLSIESSNDDEDDFFVGEDSIQSSALDPEQVMIREQQIILVQELLSQLKPKYRQLVEMRYFKDYSYEEIANDLQLPIGTVKNLLFRAKSMLAELISHKTL